MELSYKFADVSSLSCTKSDFSQERANDYKKSIKVSAKKIFM